MLQTINDHDIRVVYCLQHARVNISDRCVGGWKHHVRSLVDMIAFNPPAVAHHSIELLIGKLLDGGQTECSRYLVDTQAPSPAKIVIVNGLWLFKWNSSWRVVPYGYSGYLNNCPEGGWRAEDVMDGDTLHLRAKSLFERCERKSRVMFEKKSLECIVHMPCGENEFQTSLVRGSGMLSGKVSLYDKPWRRLTVEKMLAVINRGLPFYLPLGAKGPFVQAWVMPKQTAADFNEPRMRQFAELWFTEDAAVAARHYPRNAIGRLSLGALRQMMAKYEIVGRKRDNSFRALLRDPCIKGTCEHALLARHLFSKVDLGALHGVPRALAQPRRQKAASRKAKEQRRISRLLLDECEESTGDEAGAVADNTVPDAAPHAVMDGIVACESGPGASLLLVSGAAVGPGGESDDDAELGYADDAVSGSERSFSDAASDGEVRGDQWDEEMEAVANRVFECANCGRHHLVPPMYAAVHKAVGAMKFVCKRIPGQECRPGLARRVRRGVGRRCGNRTVAVDKPSSSARAVPEAGGSAGQGLDEVISPSVGGCSASAGASIPLAPAFAGCFPPETPQRSASHSGPAAPSQKRIRAGPKGARQQQPPAASLQAANVPAQLRNLGSTCFANSLVQVLRRSLGDRFCGGHQSCPLIAMLQPDVPPENWGLWGVFKACVQQDPVEVFDALVDPEHALHRSCGTGCAAATVGQQFRFKMQDLQRCLSCSKHRTEHKHDHVVRMSADLQPSVRPTYQACLRLLQDWSAVADFKCSLCGAAAGGLAQQVFLSAPPFLLVKAEKEAGLSKKGPPAEVDVLHLGERYSLQGVIHHAGPDPCSGHYTATVVGDGPPCFCDDWNVRPRRNVAQVVPDAYAAVYKRLPSQVVPTEGLD